ncbi:MAG TPA: carbohydrate binding domain-containing protein [Polyangiaceae bacterium]|jgi:hypothetical protein|nr:carbohydrate binding domain-containing protein [Polyangiaceae bacterium]
MRFRSLHTWLVAAPLAATGCLFQPLDSNVTSGGGGPLEEDRASDAGTVANANSGLPLDEAGLPFAFFDASLAQQCPPNSALCYELCGAPSCALTDNGIPPELATPPVTLPDGGLADDPCAQIEAESMAIRAESCAACHGPAGTGAAGITYILDDQTLLVSKSSTGVPMLIPGDPLDSFIYQQVLHGIQGSQTGMPPLNPTVGGLPPDASIPRPTSADLSILYGWILSCVGQDGGNGYASNFYGGDYIPDSDGAVDEEDAGREGGAVGAIDSGNGAQGRADSGTSAGMDASVRSGGTDAGGTGVDSGGRAPMDSGTEGADAGGTGVDSGGRAPMDSGSGGTALSDATDAHPNLITNGDFAEGTTSWGVTDGTGTLSVVGGQLCVAVTANEQVTVGWPEGDDAFGAALAAGQSYTFSYSVQTTTATGVTVTAKVRDKGMNNTPLVQAADPATNALEVETLTFTLGTTDDASAEISFMFTSSVAQSICLANVSLSQN